MLSREAIADHAALAAFETELKRSRCPQKGAGAAVSAWMKHQPEADGCEARASVAELIDDWHASQDATFEKR